MFLPTSRNSAFLVLLIVLLAGCEEREQNARCQGDCSGSDTVSVWFAGRCPADDCPLIPAEADQQAKDGAKLDADNSCVINNMNPDCGCNGTHRRQNPTCETLVQEESGNVWCIVSVTYDYRGTCAAGQ